MWQVHFLFSVSLKFILRSKAIRYIKSSPNMNYSIVLAILSCVIGLSQVKNLKLISLMFWLKIRYLQCESNDEGLEWLQEVVGECATKENASNIDIDEVLAGKEASTHSGKCFRACIGESTGIVRRIFIKPFNATFIYF